MRLVFRIEGVQEATRMLDTRGKRAKNLKAPLYKSANYMMNRIAENYQGGGSYWGRWERREKNYPWRILEKTGAMRRGFRMKVGKRQAEIRNTQPYFKYHQSGKERETALPRRIMMAIQMQEATDIEKIFQRHIMK